MQSLLRKRTNALKKIAKIADKLYDIIGDSSDAAVCIFSRDILQTALNNIPPKKNKK